MGAGNENINIINTVRGRTGWSLSASHYINLNSLPVENCSFSAIYDFSAAGSAGPAAMQPSDL